jgi:hypothetical protein
MYGVNGVDITGKAAAWGARAIWTHGFVDVLNDRMSITGSDPDKQRLISLLQDRVPTFHAINDILVEQGIDGSSNNIVVLYEDNDLYYACSPQASHGYLYLTAYLKRSVDECRAAFAN